MTNREPCIAHLNWAVLNADWDDPSVAEFVDNIDKVHLIAERCDGFIANLAGPETETLAPFVFPERDLNRDRMAVSFTLWRDIPALARFTRQTIHNRFYEKRGQWAIPVTGPTMVIFTVPDRTNPPSGAEAGRQLSRLAEQGAGPDLWGREALMAALT